MNIQINKSATTEYGKQIINDVDDFNNGVESFSWYIDQINTVWEGQDALKYINVMKEKYILRLENMASILEEYGEYLKKVPDTYQALDEAFSSKSIDI